MLSKGQLARLVSLSLLFWVAAALYIHYLPGALTRPGQAAIGFLITLPVAWASVRITWAFAGLSPRQLPTGVAVVGAIAMMIDGVAVRWFPAVYAGDASTLSDGAAWLLWGYGVSLAFAVLLSNAAPAGQPASKRSM